MYLDPKQLFFNVSNMRTHIYTIRAKWICSYTVLYKKFMKQVAVAHLKTESQKSCVAHMYTQSHKNPSPEFF
jgi:hypothetical protein